MLARNCIGLYFNCHNKAEGLVNVIAVTYAEKMVVSWKWYRLLQTTGRKCHVACSTVFDDLE